MRSLRYLKYRVAPSQHDETNCLYVSSHGLLKSCRFHHPKPQSSRDILLDICADDIEGGDSIYVPTDALHRFSIELLPHISAPFVLVTGDSDMGVNFDEIDPATLDAIAKNHHLISWFGQNLSVAQDTVHNMPIGLDYHTLAIAPNHLWGSFKTPVRQEKLLISIAQNAPKTEDKQLIAYCNWHFSLTTGRMACQARVHPQATYFEPRRTKCQTNWQSNANMLFTISPTGNGMDCHRTWEAIALGTIAIVDKTDLSPLFHALPVIEVDDWAVVTPEFLRRQKEIMLGKKYDFGPMFLGFWQQRFCGKKPDPLWLSLAEFRTCDIEKLSRLFSKTNDGANEVHKTSK